MNSTGSGIRHTTNNLLAQGPARQRRASKHAWQVRKLAMDRQSLLTPHIQNRRTSSGDIRPHGVTNTHPFIQRTNVSPQPLHPTSA
ncbi:hypothetical protein EJ06DRAFT_65700 [Trichodelitschia bisporula]|uniref:Uncharacterized protein n=1 Tax=Trichodelitschia bisporula TaxID=703511 RepID=A0A6G1HT35_9PEZI|nr:hypothetical protein EJ06DRAFT_65700 [Trichodelitschia bisporula]